MGTVRSKWENIYAEEFPEEKPEVAPAQPKSERVVKSVKPETHKETPKKEAIKDEPAAPEKQLPGQMEVADYPELMPEATQVAVQVEEDANKSEHGDSAGVAESIREPEDSGRTEGERNEVPGREPKTPQSNGENKSTESEEYKTLKEETEELANGVYDVFWGWSDDKIIPKGELQMALKNAKKLVI